MKYLDEIDEEAELLGAVNTVKRVNDKFIGYNTDGRGFVKMLNDNDIEFKDKSILILGAGGAGRGISLILAKEGVREIHILNRTEGKAKELAVEIKNKLPETLTGWGSLKDTEVDCQKFNIVINTTSMGMYPNVDSIPMNPRLLRKDSVVVDIVYKPVMTSFLSECERMEMKVVNGMELLIEQAVFSQSIWNNCDVNIGELYNIIKEGNVDLMKNM